MHTTDRAYLTPAQAAELADRTEVTVTNWCRRFPALGTKVVGRWRVDPDVLQRILAGEAPASAASDRAA